MKLLCPRCRAGKEIGGASRYSVFACDSCGYHFRGSHAQIARWNRLFKQLFTLDTTTAYADRTPCPHCGGWVPLDAGDDGLTCMYCGRGIRTSRVVNFSDAELAELRHAFRLAEITPEKERELRAMLRDFDWHPRDRNELDRLLAEASAKPTGRSPAGAQLAPASPAVEREIAEFRAAMERGEISPLPDDPPEMPAQEPPALSGYKRTTQYVLLKVAVLHRPGADPADICKRAEFGYDDTDGAVEGAEVVGVEGEPVFVAGRVETPSRPPLDPDRLVAIRAMMRR